MQPFFLVTSNCNLSDYTSTSSLFWTPGIIYGKGGVWCNSVAPIPNQLWAPEEPNNIEDNRCVALYHDADPPFIFSGLRAVDCAFRLPFICQDMQQLFTSKSRGKWG
jgi:hypothetical protein